MGCGTSRNVVAPQSITIEDKPRKDFVNEETPVCTEKNVETISPPSPTPSQRSTSSRVSIRSKSDRPVSRGGKSSLRKRFEKMKQEVDLMDEGGDEVGVSGQDKVVSTREPSAVSKASGNTTDSGYADENPCMITEDSAPHDQEVAKRPRPITPDLSVSGKGLMSRRICSATTRHLQELKVSLKPLQVTERSTSSPSITSHKQSLSETPPTKSVSFAEDHELSPQIIQRPASRGGMAFDIQFTPETGNTKRTPSKLARLERKTKSAEALRQDLEERLRAAEERRKENERKLLERLEQQKLKEDKVQSALDSFAKKQSEKTQHLLDKRMTANQENREAHLKMLRDRLQAQKDKGEKVRMVKKTLPPQIPVTAE